MNLFSNMKSAFNPLSTYTFLGGFFNFHFLCRKSSKVHEICEPVKILFSLWSLSILVYMLFESSFDPQSADISTIFQLSYFSVKKQKGLENYRSSKNNFLIRSYSILVVVLLGVPSLKKTVFQYPPIFIFFQKRNVEWYHHVR